MQGKGNASFRKKNEALEAASFNRIGSLYFSQRQMQGKGNACFGKMNEALEAASVNSTGLYIFSTIYSSG